MLYFLKRIISLILAFSCIFISIPIYASAYPVNTESAAVSQPSSPGAGSYSVYRQRYVNAKASTQEIVLAAADYVEQSGADAKIAEYNGVSKALLWDSMQGSVTWQVEISETALYAVLLRYCPREGNGSDIDLGLKIDDTYPFDEADSCKFYRIWQDESGMKTLPGKLRLHRTGFINWAPGIGRN